MTTQFKHAFVPFTGTDFICRKCGQVAANTRQIQSLVDHQECISDDDSRCADTMKGVLDAIEHDKLTPADLPAINQSIEEYEAWKASGDVTPIPVTFTPSTLKEHKQFLDWLNSPDPIKALWGIED